MVEPTFLHTVCAGVLHMCRKLMMEIILISVQELALFHTVSPDLFLTPRIMSVRLRPLVLVQHTGTR